MQERPRTIRVILALGALRLLGLILIPIIYYLTRNSYDKTLFAGFVSYTRKRFGLQNTEQEMAILAGLLSVPLILTILLLWFVNRRKFWPAVIVTGIDLLFGLSQESGIFGILILILLWTNPSKEYLGMKTSSGKPG
ncbi:MAG TPA: hypothetical protein VIN08_22585 [Ohtaekwangia sp.]|uniref:hypothetical protein n=1 Tax=Ohtaekwangia sp. TaxID=2066019 RepID=UPI002F95D1DF